jgi:hypothetical protein
VIQAWPFFLGGGFLAVSGTTADDGSTDSAAAALGRRCAFWPPSITGSGRQASTSCACRGRSPGGCWKCGSPARTVGSCRCKCPISTRCAAVSACGHAPPVYVPGPRTPVAFQSSRLASCEPFLLEQASFCSAPQRRSCSTFNHGPHAGRHNRPGPARNRNRTARLQRRRRASAGASARAKPLCLPGVRRSQHSD